MYIPKKTFNVIESFPYDIEIIPHVWIKLADGCRLSAKIWLPKNAKKEPVPAVLEYIPYRKRDITTYRDSINHTYLAGHGFASVRVDLRGSGDSEGILKDEYLELELQDGVEVIEWIAQQPWCSGSVGMMGKSWGGFNALQVAARRPEALKAIVTVSSADDRYSTDVHYMGGCLLGDNLSWASEMFAFNACPPDPLIQGEGWKKNWLERLDKSGVWLKPWLEHSYRDEYWRHGSVCENYSQIQCPVYAISGWADGYSNTVFSLMKNLDVPRLGLVGPWGHNYPHLGMPGPGMGFLQELVLWWKQWLKNEETGIMKQPKLRVWMQEHAPPSFTLAKRPGHWVGAGNWPSDSVEEKKYYFKGEGLHEAHSEESISKVQSPLSVGLFSGKWCSFSSTPDLPHDQREEDGGALVLETSELEEPIEILGAPSVKLRLKASKSVAMIAIRLCDVAPNGKATRVSYGLLNLCHRNSHEKPEYLPKDEYVDATVHLNHVAQRFEKGHYIRLSISTSYWPIVWPSPEPVQLIIDNASSYFILPRLSAPLEKVQKLSEPEGAQPLDIQRKEPQDYRWRVIRNLGEDQAVLEVLKDEGQYYIPSVDIEVSRCSEEKYSYYHDNFNSLSGTVEAQRQFVRESDNWKIFTETKTKLTSDEKRFYISADLDAYENQRRIYSNSWHYTVERKFL